MKTILKKIIIVIALFCLILPFAGCGKGNSQNEPQENLPEETEAVGTFYTVQEAYDNGWLTQEAVMSIAYYHNGGREHNEEIMSESYEPTAKTPEVLSEATELKIKNTAAKDYREKYNIKDAEAAGFTITEYCGTYGNCVAVMMEDLYTGTGEVVWTDSIAEVKIYYGSGRAMKIWREERLTEISYSVVYEGVSYDWSADRKNFIGICSSNNDLIELCTKNNYGFYDKENPDYESGLCKKVREYTEEFFKSKSLVVCAFTESSYSGSLKVLSLEVVENKLTLKIKRTDSDTADDVMVCWGFIIEVDKSIVSVVTDSTYLVI